MFSDRLASAILTRLRYVRVMKERKGMRRARDRKKPSAERATAESSVSEAATIAWTVCVTTLIACDVTAAAAHVYFLQHPDARRAALLGGLMLLAGAVIGLGTLALTPVVYRVRRTPPPTGFAVFAVCAALAPMIALAARALQ
jgi:hypothetical protein